MFRTLKWSVLLATAALLVTAAPASALSAVPYAIQGGKTMTFVVHGSSADVILDQGDVTVDPVTPFLGVLAQVKLTCNEDPSVVCTGVLVVT